MIRSTWPAMVVKRAAKLARIRARAKMAEVHCLSPVAPGSLNTSQPIRLVLHIGPHKTGSTSIQVALDRNYRRLLTDGFLYPSGIFPDRQHSSVFQVITQGKEDAATHFFLSLRGLAVRNNCHTVILSGEQISLLGEQHLQRVHSALAEANFDSLVVAFSRPPLGLLASRISQWMISYRQHFVTPYVLAKAIKEYSVDSIIEKFRRVFGVERVSVQDLADGGDAIEMFAAAAGIELRPEARRNTRTDFAVMSFINAIKADFYLSPANIRSAYSAAFGDGRREFESELKFTEELLHHIEGRREHEILAPAVEKARKLPRHEWTHEDQVEYLRRFENFIHNLRREHAWALKSRVKNREERMKEGVERVRQLSG